MSDTDKLVDALDGLVTCLPDKIDVPITGYEVRVNSGEPIDVGNVLEYIVTGLEEETIYQIQVRSYDELGRRSRWRTVFAETLHANPTIQRLVECNRERELWS